MRSHINIVGRRIINPMNIQTEQISHSKNSIDHIVSYCNTPDWHSVGVGFKFRSRF